MNSIALPFIAAYSLALEVFYFGASGNAMQVRANGRDLDNERLLPNPDECTAHAELAKSYKAWEKKLPKDDGKLFAWLLKQDEKTVQDLIVYCAAVTVDAVVGKYQSTGSNPSDLVHTDELAKTLGLDTANYWEPTAKGFVGRLNKAQMSRAMSEAGCADHEIKHMQSFKKDDAVSITASKLSGKRWLPRALQPEGK